MDANKCCSFFGHRKIEYSEELKEKLKSLIIDLIENKKVNDFLFGSKSEFNSLCLKVVSELKELYPFLNRVGYTCRSESFILEREKEEWKMLFSDVLKSERNFDCVDEEFEHKNKFVAGKGSYVERNYAMIDDSNYCVFYYNPRYTISNKKSGTKIAYEYAKRKKKEIFNLFNTNQ
ncbi:MAG: hypothetical protein IKC83_01470 [Clostridia bacterium]|nr:hypothetical protein [Clostridia bacterium]